MLPVSAGPNEWGHTFWFREEFFAAPIHYGFVVGVWFALGAGASVVIRHLWQLYLLWGF